jgi:hypothetical protein
MIQDIHGLNGQVVTSIHIRTDEDVRGNRGGHMGYEIVIETHEGRVIIGGCHDLGPEVVDLPDKPHAKDK